MSGAYICLFKVIYNDPNGKNVEECGFCFADTFAGAAEYLEKELYGDDLMEIRHLELLDNCPVVSPETWTKMREELNV